MLSVQDVNEILLESHEPPHTKTTEWTYGLLSIAVCLWGIIMSLTLALRSRAQGENHASPALAETVARGTQNCFDRFERCITLAAMTNHMELVLVQNQFARFSLWVSNVGVFAPGRTSLDYRLQEAEDVHRLVRGLLESLNEALEICR